MTPEDKKKLKVELHNLRDKVFMLPECEIVIWDKKIEGKFVEEEK